MKINKKSFSVFALIALVLSQNVLLCMEQNGSSSSSQQKAEIIKADRAKLRALAVQRAKTLKALETNPTCPICKKESEEDRSKGWTCLEPCGHPFHVDCICDWALHASEQSRNQCPVCTNKYHLTLFDDTLSKLDMGKKMILAQSLIIPMNHDIEEASEKRLDELNKKIDEINRYTWREGLGLFMILGSMGARFDYDRAKEAGSFPLMGNVMNIVGSVEQSLGLCVDEMVWDTWSKKCYGYETLLTTYVIGLMLFPIFVAIGASLIGRSFSERKEKIKPLDAEKTNIKKMFMENKNGVNHENK